MRRTSDLASAIALVGAFYVALPALLIWGWVRWVKRSKSRTLCPILSLAGFSLASLSAVLAISAITYALFVRPFPFYDPSLVKIYGVGGLLSLGGFVFAVGGLWRPSPLRWHAPACAIGMLLFWFAMAASE
jgi:hypothetical protein